MFCVKVSTEEWLIDERNGKRKLRLTIENEKNKQKRAWDLIRGFLDKKSH